MISIYNTLTRKKEEFVPLKKGELKMYACGITPYDEIHIGHARQAVVYDVIRNYFEYANYQVQYVRNYTDIDDKIIKRANREGKESHEISEYFIKENSSDLDLLKVKRATYEPKVTECIPEIIAFIEKLLDKGAAYEKNGEVFFAVDKFKDYGKLSNRKVDELINSDVSPNKINAADFSLWKPSKPDEPAWDSPWGPGRPGWHIECSAMALKYLGEVIDIHGGGLDLIFPHHENEIAQSEAAIGENFAHYWLHNGLVMIDNVKMSKSLGNFLTVKDALKKYFPEEIRFAILSQNYNSNVDFSSDLFLMARKRIYYFYNTLLKVNSFSVSANEPTVEVELPLKITQLEDKFKEFMDDNFNTVKVITEVSEVFKVLNTFLDSSKYSVAEKSFCADVFFKNFIKISQVLSLWEEVPAEYLRGLKDKFLLENEISSESIQVQITKYQLAKTIKNYAEMDAIKDELKNKNITLQDRGDVVEWEIIF
ncbi:MAG: cysteine--tRNA ligase [Candidatus Moraniibacteriota bacterium]